MWAITNGDTDLVRILLAHGADPGVKDEWGEDAFEYADSDTVSNDAIRALLAEWKRRA
jgi:ankyrin repeat protein